ncbi:MAG: HD domain-containing protein [Candidatus Dojkabacteria bacterium]
MKTTIDLSKYESLYDSFDKGHDRKHMEGVRTFALKLAKKYCPKKIEIIYVSATLHDIGLSISRENHEHNGYEIIKKDVDMKKAYSKKDFELILESIREHRASTGNPKSIVAKIVSDSDKVYGDTKGNFERSYEYCLEKDHNAEHNVILERAASHLYTKFKEGGTGTRVYFKESKERLVEAFKPIIKAYENRDYKRLDKILEDTNDE